MEQSSRDTHQHVHEEDEVREVSTPLRGRADGVDGGIAVIDFGLQRDGRCMNIMKMKTQKS